MLKALEVMRRVLLWTLKDLLYSPEVIGDALYLLEDVEGARGAEVMRQIMGYILEAVDCVLFPVML